MSILSRLGQHILVDGFHTVIDLDRSHGAWIVDKETGATHLDCYSQFASQALGWNHPELVAAQAHFGKIAMHKMANSDMYSEVFCEFVEKFAKIASDFKYFFFIDGGALAVENALKAAFDWKCQMQPQFQSCPEKLDVIHLQEAFHGRSGYTLSLTNTGDLKTKWFPKFEWTRILNPKTQDAEAISLAECENALKNGNVAAIIIEPIQGEGGDNHFRKEYLQGLRDLADKYEALLIFDEVQTGVGLTGKMWAYQHFDVKPDLMCFGKKTQVCGFCSNGRIESAPENVFKKSYRINSTWGGNIVDMARACVIFDTIEKENLVENAAKVGQAFRDKLVKLDGNFPGIFSNIRGQGLMNAVDFADEATRDKIYDKLRQTTLALKSGNKSIRFRPHLDFNAANLDCFDKFFGLAIT